MKLGFIVGGVQKAGTTALFEYLSRHRDLSAPCGKELHFFDNEAIDWQTPDYDEMHRCFPGPGIRFEATPIYLFWPGSIERILAYHPGIRLIFLFRDPIERAFSQWSMEFARGNENLSFQQAIGPGRDRLLSEEPRSAARKHWSYVERGFYGRQVSDLLAFAPRRQTLFLRSEDLDLEPRQTLDRITDFLDIQRFGTVAPLRAHQRRSASYPSVLEKDDIALLRDEYRADMELFSTISGLDVASWLTMRRD